MAVSVETRGFPRSRDARTALRRSCAVTGTLSHIAREGLIPVPRMSWVWSRFARRLVTMWNVPWNVPRRFR